MVITYGSFADETCLGVLLLPGELNPIEFAMQAHLMGCNPGGELLAIPMDTSDPSCPPHVAENMIANMNRLLTKDEAVELFDAARLGDMDGSN